MNLFFILLSSLFFGCSSDNTEESENKPEITTSGDQNQKENIRSTEDKSVFFAEMFSISPCDEHLNWSVCTHSERDVPQLQARTARWLRYLNS